MKLSLGPIGPALLACVATLSIACNGSIVDDPIVTPAPTATPTTPPSVPPIDPPAVKPTIAWGTCEVPGYRGGIQAECATVDLPARREVVGSGTVPVAIYRLKSRKQPATGQLWMLNGGPGGAGFSLAPYGEIVSSSFAQGIDVYLVDHRGTGESGYLDCPKAYRTGSTPNDFSKKCSDEVRGILGDKLDGFSTTESAKDVRDLIAATAAPAQKVFLYGGSYGSYWAHRFLQLPDSKVDAVVTDGNCLSSTCSFDTPQTFGMDEAVGAMLDVCKETASCTAKLGAEPRTFFREVLAKLATGHCARTKLSQLAPADIALALGPSWQQGIFPTFYRLNRCSDADVKVLDTLVEKLEEANQRSPLPVHRFGPTPNPSSAHGMSTALLVHVVALEMISRPVPSRAVLAAKAAMLELRPGEDSLDLSYFDAWQPYPRDTLVNGWVKRDVPWLVMQGTFDFQTVYSLSQEALKYVEDPSLQFVRIDGGNHGVVFDSECSLAMLEAFLKDPKAKVDASCVKDVKRVSLDVDSRYSEYFFGVTDAWD